MAERPEDLNLPNSIVGRLIRDALPEGISVSREARSAIARAASVFVLYTTACANNSAMSHKRKVLLADDVIAAMRGIDMSHLVEPLQKCLDFYRRARREAEQEQSVLIRREDPPRSRVQQPRQLMVMNPIASSPETDDSDDFDCEPTTSSTNLVDKLIVDDHEIDYIEESTIEEVVPFSDEFVLE